MGTKVVKSQKAIKKEKKQLHFKETDNDESETNTKFLHKRKRFRELVRLHLIHKVTTENLINELFIKPKDRSILEKPQNLEEYKIEQGNLIYEERKDNNVKEEANLIEEEKVFFSKSTCESSNNDKEEKISSRSNLRDKYYVELMKSNYFIRNRNQDECQNILIFDWDDTIMCTTYLTPNGFFTEKNLKEVETKKDPVLFAQLETLIVQLLTFAIGQGHTYIVTNAASGWVEFSTRLFFPDILSLLEKVIVISARNWFEKEYPGDSRLWKQKCFEEIGKIYSPHKTTNLITVGDSLIEMEAAYKFAKCINTCYIKTIKLKDSPSPTQLAKQLKLIVNDLPNIAKLQQNVTISVKKEDKIDKLNKSMKSSEKEKNKLNQTVQNHHLTAPRFLSKKINEDKTENKTKRKTKPPRLTNSSQGIVFQPQAQTTKNTKQSSSPFGRKTLPPESSQFNLNK